MRILPVFLTILLCVTLNISCDDGEDSQEMLIDFMAGTNTAGTNTAGTNTAGTNTAGTNTAGTNTAGTNTAGTNTAGMENTGGANIAGVENTGGTQAPAGMETAPVDCTGATAEDPCVVSVYAARQPNIVPNETMVSVEAVITAIRINADGQASHIVLQDPSGGPYSGIWVYVNDAEVDVLPIFNEGAVVRLTAMTEDYFGQRQLNSITSIIQMAEGPMIQPMVVSPNEVSTNGSQAPALEGVLIRVENVRVEDVAPPIGPGDSEPINEFVVTGGLRVDDFFLPTPLPMVGDQFLKITGILRLGNGDYKLEPRTASDFSR